MALRQGQRYVRVDVADILRVLLEAAASPRRRLHTTNPGLSPMFSPDERIVGASVDVSASGTPVVMVFLVEKVEDAQEGS
ncbi:hypothetical protein LCGC14_2507750 [marine sediment metagenome]|uniref:Uncharacterized protein n=1 Tax=marine sediment metagenome TaxID=412755 RepID=A0A0F9B038_9ZZZZ